MTRHVYNIYHISDLSASLHLNRRGTPRISQCQNPCSIFHIHHQTPASFPKIPPNHPRSPQILPPPPRPSTVTTCTVAAAFPIEFRCCRRKPPEIRIGGRKGGLCSSSHGVRCKVLFLGFLGMEIRRRGRGRGRMGCVKKRGLGVGEMGCGRWEVSGVGANVACLCRAGLKTVWIF